MLSLISCNAHRICPKREATETEIGTGKWAIVVKNRESWLWKLWKTQELWSPKIVEHYKQTLNWHPSGTFKDITAENYEDLRRLAQKILGGRWYWKCDQRYFFWYFAKNVNAFYPCSKNFPETKLKCIEYIFLRGTFQNSLVLSLLHIC